MSSQLDLRLNRSHPLIADADAGQGERKRDVKILYLTINEEDLAREIDWLAFDYGKTEI